MQRSWPPTPKHGCESLPNAGRSGRRTDAYPPSLKSDMLVPPRGRVADTVSGADAGVQFLTRPLMLSSSSSGASTHGS
eukprot:3865777-Prymnesium_polylepis.2